MTAVVVHHWCVKEETYVRTNETGLYVRIKVAFEIQIQRSLDVSPHAFERLGGHGGTSEEYYVAVTSGARSALNDAATGGAVTILEVDYSPAHTSPEEVRLASFVAVAYAMRRLL
jgi:hypothetical protein